MLTRAAVRVDPVARHDKQGDTFHTRRPARNLGQYQVDDVLAQFVFAAGNPHLVAGNRIGPVFHQLGPGTDVRQG